MKYYKKDYCNEPADNSFIEVRIVNGIIYVTTEFELIPPWEEITENEWAEAEAFFLPETDEAYTPDPTAQDVINSEILLLQVELVSKLNALENTIQAMQK